LSVSHVQDDDTVIPGLLSLLARVPDPRKRRGRRFGLVFVPAVAAVTVLAGATNFRKVGDHAGDLSQQLDATVLDQIIGGWLRDLAEVG
jgi:hypothetical protein